MYVERTLPPNTSSPMMRHAAVLIMRMLLASADITLANDVRDRPDLAEAAELCR